ncbi:glycoside hydrolase family 114 protein [Stipitochalara longipes BDJ]|nr:glycoside hydrolase family 114 protein [Stipitochalara longipes BDJ]
MQLLPSLAAVAALSINLASAFPNERRFVTAPVVPTGCTVSQAPPTNTPSCAIPGLPTTLSTTLTLTTATPLASWSSRPAAQATPGKYTWQMVLQNNTKVTASANDGIDIYDIDIDSSPDTFNSILSAGKYLVCYFSAGSSEAYRSDVGCFNTKLGAGDYGCNYGGAYKDEYWLNTSSIEVRRIMQDRIAKAHQKNCSAIDPDNIDAYGNQNGIGATMNDSISFMQFLADESHSRGMGIGLKNSLEILDSVSSIIDFAVNEECVKYGECDSYTSFLATGAPVVNIEYPNNEDPDVQHSFNKSEADSRCSTWKSLGLPSLATTLKGYPTVTCGVSRCILDANGNSGELPPVPAGGPLPIPSGCVDGSS